MAGYAEAIGLLQIEVEEDRRSLFEKEAALRFLQRAEALRQSRVGASFAAPEGVIPAPIDLNRVVGAPPARARTLAEEVDAVVRRLGEQEVSVPLVQVLLEKEGVTVGGKYPRSRLSTIMNDLMATGLLVRSFEGGGNVPHRYRLAGANPEPLPQKAVSVE